MDDDKKDDTIDTGVVIIDIKDLPTHYGDGFKERAYHDIVFNWSGAIDEEKSKAEPQQKPGEYRWITAIQKVSPKSGAFWFDYGKRYNEKVVVKLNKERNPKGERLCDIMVHTKRTVGDVVTSAWSEYNRWLVKK